MFEKDTKISLLLDFYGELLSEHKREAIDLYYNDDLSLSEIAEQMEISRQGVRDLIKKGEAQLSDYEDKLGLAERFGEVGEKLKSVSHRLNEAAESGITPDELKRIATELGSISI